MIKTKAEIKSKPINYETITNRIPGTEIFCPSLLTKVAIIFQKCLIKDYKVYTIYYIYIFMYIYMCTYPLT